MNYASINDVPDTFLRLTQGWEHGFAQIGLNLLFALWFIGFAIEAFWWALSNRTIEGLWPLAVRQILIVSAGQLLINNCLDWSTAVVRSFQQSVEQVTGLAPDLSPATILQMGISTFEELLKHMSLFNPAESLTLAVLACVVLLMFAIIAGLMIVALVEFAMVMAVMPLFLAWIALPWTRQTGLSAAVFPLASGAKLCVMMLLVAVLQTMLMDWSHQFNDNNAESIDTLAMLVTTACMLVYTIPSLASSMIHGTAGAGIGALAGAAATMGAAAKMGVGAVTGLGGAGGALAAGVSLAKEQASASGLALSGLSGAGKIATMAAKNVAGAMSEQTEGRLAGTHRGGHIWGAKATLVNQARMMNEESKAPKP